MNSNLAALNAAHDELTLDQSHALGSYLLGMLSMTVDPAEWARCLEKSRAFAAGTRA